MGGDDRSECERPVAATTGSPTYDSFVVRLWRTPGAAVIRRIELEHVQSGVRLGAAEVALAWILPELDQCLLDAIATGSES